MSRVFARMAMAFALTLICVSATADDVQAIVDRYIDATGGREAREEITSLKMSGTLSIPRVGMDASITAHKSPPEFLFIVDSNLTPPIKSGICDGTHWEINPAWGDKILDGEKARALEKRAAIHPWLTWEETYGRVTSVRDETFDDVAVTKVEFKNEAGDRTSVYFSKKSGLIIAEDTIDPESGDPSTRRLSNYRDVAGVKFPHTVKTEMSFMKIELTYDEIQVNPEFPADTFDLPDVIAALK